jgi:hypothetical protein
MPPGDRRNIHARLQSLADDRLFLGFAPRRRVSAITEYWWGKLSPETMRDGGESVAASP